jgi:hypothetical protein
LAGRCSGFEKRVFLRDCGCGESPWLKIRKLSRPSKFDSNVVFNPGS